MKTIVHIRLPKWVQYTIQYVCQAQACLKALADCVLAAPSVSPSICLKWQDMHK